MSMVILTENQQVSASLGRKGVMFFNIKDELSNNVGYCYFIEDEKLKESLGNIGYYIDNQYRKKGYASGAVIALCNHVKNRGFKTATIKVRKDNTPSLQVIEKISETYSVTVSMEKKQYSMYTIDLTD